MAALAETPQYMIDAESSEPRLSLHGLAMPLTIRFAKAPSDEDVVRFSQQNQPYRIERNAAGELEIMSPGFVSRRSAGSVRHGHAVRVCTAA